MSGDTATASATSTCPNPECFSSLVKQPDRTASLAAGSATAASSVSRTSRCTSSLAGRPISSASSWVCRANTTSAWWRRWDSVRSSSPESSFCAWRIAVPSSRRALTSSLRVRVNMFTSQAALVGLFIFLIALATARSP